MFFGIILCTCTVTLFIVHTSNLVLVNRRKISEQWFKDKPE